MRVVYLVVSVLMLIPMGLMILAPCFNNKCAQLHTLFDLDVALVSHLDS